MLKRLTLKATATGEPGEDKRDGLANCPGPSLAVAKGTLEEAAVGGEGIIAGEYHDDCSGQERGQEREQGDEKCSQRTGEGDFRVGDRHCPTPSGDDSRVGGSG